MSKDILRYTLIIVLFLSLGCASTKELKAPESLAEQKPPVSGQAEEIKSQDTADVPQVQQTQQSPVQELTLPSFTAPSPPKALPRAEPIDPKRVIHVEGPLMLNVEAMPLSDFIIYALGNTLKVTFFMDEQVKNMKDPVTLRMTQEMPADRVFEIVLGMFERYNLIVEEKAGALYILQKRLAPQKPTDIRTGRNVQDSPADIVQIVTLKYLRHAEIQNIMGELYKTGVNVRLHPKENALILSGQASAIKEIVNFIEIFDVPYVEGKKAFILRLVYWQTDEFLKQITQILEGIGFNISKFSKDAGIVFLPIKALNSILVLAPDDISAKYVLEWKEKLDNVEAAGTEEKSYSYIPKFSKASDLVDALKNLYSVVQPSAVPAASASQQKSAQSAPSVLSISGLKMAADDRRNIILISATPSQYRSILSYLENLDVPPRQVLIDVTIAELTLTDDLKYGLEWYIKSSMKDGSFTLQTLDQLSLNTGTGLGFQFVSDNQKFEAAINAFAQENKINILSNPRLLVIDNQEAAIQIGTDVPIISGETKSTSADTQTTVTTQSVQYKSTGLIVRVTPNINTEGMLTLEISIESSEAGQNTLSEVNSPIILTRRLTTSVVATTKQTILLGGLMSENLSDTFTKVPLLGDIPLLGHLFKTTSKSKTKTELIIMIKPVIITNTDDAVRLTNELKQSIEWMK